MRNEKWEFQTESKSQVIKERRMAKIAFIQWTWKLNLHVSIYVWKCFLLEPVSSFVGIANWGAGQARGGNRKREIGTFYFVSFYMLCVCVCVRFFFISSLSLSPSYVSPLSAVGPSMHHRMQLLHSHTPMNNVYAHFTSNV